MSNYSQYSSAAGAAYSGAFAAAASAGSTYPHGLHMPNPSYPYPSPYSQSPYPQSPYFWTVTTMIKTWEREEAPSDLGYNNSNQTPALSISIWRWFKNHLFYKGTMRFISLSDRILNQDVSDDESREFIIVLLPFYLFNLRILFVISSTDVFYWSKSVSLNQPASSMLLTNIR